MYSVRGTDIKLTRGDTLLLQLELLKNGTAYIPQEGDSIRFALKRNKMNANNTDFIERKPIVLKNIPNDTLVLRLESEDTKNLAFGSYVYDMQITFADGTVDTFIPNAKIEITPEVD